MPLEIGQLSDADAFVLRCELTPMEFSTDATSFDLTHQKPKGSHECGAIIKRKTLDLAALLSSQYIYGVVEYQGRLFRQTIYEAPGPSYHRLLALQSIIWQISWQHNDQCPTSMSILRSILPLTHTISEGARSMRLGYLELAKRPSETLSLPASSRPS